MTNNKSDPVAKKPGAPAQKPQPTAIKTAQVKKGLEVVNHRNEYYRDGNKKMYVAAIVSIVGVFAQALIAYSGIAAKNERVYIATDRNGSLITLMPLSQPNQKPEVIAQWMQNGLVDTFSFNFTDINNRLDETTKKWFTKNGADQFLREMKDSGHMDVVRDGKMIMSLTLDHTPIKIGEGYAPGTSVYSWSFQADAVLTFRTQSKEYSKKVRFTVVIERRSVLENVEGLGIAKIVMTNR